MKELNGASLVTIGDGILIFRRVEQASWAVSALQMHCVPSAVAPAMAMAGRVTASRSWLEWQMARANSGGAPLGEGNAADISFLCWCVLLF